MPEADQSETKEQTLSKEATREVTFQLDWDDLSKLFVPNMDSVWIIVKTHKGTDKIIDITISNKQGDKISLKNGAVP